MIIFQCVDFYERDKYFLGKSEGKDRAAVYQVPPIENMSVIMGVNLPTGIHEYLIRHLFYSLQV